MTLRLFYWENRAVGKLRSKIEKGNVRAVQEGQARWNTQDRVVRVGTGEEWRPKSKIRKLSPRDRAGQGDKRKRRRNSA